MNGWLFAMGFILIGMAATGPSTAAADAFAPDRALAHVSVLAGEIGPRKTGTPGEAGARDFIADQMAPIGLRVLRRPVARVGGTFVGSENSIGILEGKTRDTILIGSHHDSRSTDVPGANDDASGVGVVLESARVLASDPPVTTVLFASFCAEEDGLLGARHFAATQDLSRVKVVLNMDPVGQGGIVVAPFPAAPPLWGNRALAGAARREAIPGVLLDPLHLIASRSLGLPFGADHQPFAEEGVPAFSLSCRVRLWTYHTERDRLDQIDETTLSPAGRALVALVRRYDETPPEAVARGNDATYVILPTPWVSGPVIWLAVAPGGDRVRAHPRSAASPSLRHPYVCVPGAGGILTLRNVTAGPAYDSRNPRLRDPSQYSDTPLDTAPGLRDLIEPAVMVEPAGPAAQEEGRRTREIRVMALAPHPTDRPRLTPRPTEPPRILDEGVWITRSGLSRRSIRSQDAPADLFRVEGRPGQRIEREVKIDFDREILGAEVSSDDAVVQWISRITWKGSAGL